MSPEMPEKQSKYSTRAMGRRLSLLNEANPPPSRALRATASLADAFGGGGKVRTTSRASALAPRSIE
jgi:hypothetical protein